MQAGIFEFLIAYIIILVFERGLLDFIILKAIAVYFFYYIFFFQISNLDNIRDTPII